MNSLVRVCRTYTANPEKCQSISVRSPRDRSPRRLKLGNTVLIVDDAEFMRVMLREILEDMDLTVVGEAVDGVEAIEVFKRTRPEMVLLDITMPNMDGNEALTEILSVAPETTVVMITALGQKDQVLTAIKSGARDFIIKPFDQERVQETLSNLLATVS